LSARGRCLIFGRPPRSAARTPEQHPLDRFGTHLLDAVTPDDLAELVRELRRKGPADAAIVIVTGVVNRIYPYAARRLGWVGTNPVLLMLSSARPSSRTCWAERAPTEVWPLSLGGSRSDTSILGK
jgi:hypothetical protein